MCASLHSLHMWHTCCIMLDATCSGAPCMLLIARCIVHAGFVMHGAYQTLTMCDWFQKVRATMKNLIYSNKRIKTYWRKRELDAPYQTAGTAHSKNKIPSKHPLVFETVYDQTLNMFLCFEGCPTRLLHFQHSDWNIFWLWLSYRLPLNCKDFL